MPLITIEDHELKQLGREIELYRKTIAIILNALGAPTTLDERIGKAMKDNELMLGIHITGNPLVAEDIHVINIKR